MYNQFRYELSNTPLSMDITDCGRGPLDPTSKEKIDKDKIEKSSMQTINGIGCTEAI